MGKTADLRKLITAQLNDTPGVTYYRTAPDRASFPYKTFDLQRVNMDNRHRDDIDLCVDVWDHARDPKTVESIADQIEALFTEANLPQETILPTFFRDSRFNITEEDTDIQHIQLHFLVETYEKED